MVSPTSDPGPVTRSFDDFEDFAGSLAKLGWKMEFRQLDPGGFRARVRAITVGPFRISHLRVDSRLQVFGQMPEGHLSLGIPLEIPGQASWMRQPLSDETLQRYASGSQFEAVTPAQFETLMVAIGPSHLEQQSEIEDSLLDIETSRVACPISVRRSLGERLLGVIRDTGHTQADSSWPAIKTDVLERITDVLSDPVFRRNESSEPPKGWVRCRVLKQAEEMIRASDGEAVSVGDLVKHCSTSKSTLERAFKDAYGVNPKGYLIARRLHEVRMDLKAADPATTKVADIANRWGFWHMGQFAKDYMKFFCELPSATLQQPAGLRSGS